jgi:hypothetical protein
MPLRPTDRLAEVHAQARRNAKRGGRSGGLCNAAAPYEGKKFSVQVAVRRYLDHHRAVCVSNVGFSTRSGFRDLCGLLHFASPF